MDRKQIIGALIGLCGAVNNNGKTSQTDQVVREALLSDDAGTAAERIRREKFAVSPNCETCAFPCGNTSDYDMARFEDAPEKVIRLKEQIIDEIFRLAAREPLPEIIYRAAAYIGYNMTEETYAELLEEMRQ